VDIREVDTAAGANCELLPLQSWQTYGHDDQNTGNCQVFHGWSSGLNLHKSAKTAPPDTKPVLISRFMLSMQNHHQLFSNFNHPNQSS
jgi:hypothetical protein